MHAANVVLPAGGLRFLRGEELVATYAPPDAAMFAHHFCRTCGATMPRTSDAMGVTVVPLGSVDALPASVQPERHIFAGSKASWYDIPGSLPQHDTYPG